MCVGCRSVDTGNGATNYMYMDGGGGDLAKQVREDLVDLVSTGPVGGKARYKCCIIDEFQAFNHTAKSALLGIFEELNPRAVIICTTTDLETIHEALRDRAYEINFAPISPEEQVKGVLRFKPELEPYSDVLNILAKKSKGTQRRLWSILDRLDGDFSPESIALVTGGTTKSKRTKIISLAFARNFKGVNDLWSSWVSQGINMTVMMEDLLEDLCNLAAENPNDVKYTRAIKALSQASILNKPEVFKRALFTIAPEETIKYSLKEMYEAIFNE